MFSFPSSLTMKDAGQCVVMNTGKKSGIEVVCGLLSQIPCSTLICLQQKKRAVDIRRCSVRDGLKGGL